MYRPLCKLVHRCPDFRDHVGNKDILSQECQPCEDDWKWPPGTNSVELEAKAHELQAAVERMVSQTRYWVFSTHDAPKPADVEKLRRLCRDGRGGGVHLHSIVHHSKQWTEPLAAAKLLLVMHQLLACGSSELLLEAVDFVRFYDTLGSRFHLSAAVVEQHKSPSSCWMMAHGKVYDGTHFVLLHPGGPTAIINHGGKECTEDFDFHSASARKLWELHCIGKLKPNAKPSSSSGWAVFAQRYADYLARRLKLHADIPEVCHRDFTLRPFELAISRLEPTVEQLERWTPSRRLLVLELVALLRSIMPVLEAFPLTLCAQWQFVYSRVLLRDAASICSAVDTYFDMMHQSAATSDADIDIAYREFQELSSSLGALQSQALLAFLPAAEKCKQHATMFLGDEWFLPFTSAQLDPAERAAAATKLPVPIDFGLWPQPRASSLRAKSS